MSQFKIVALSGSLRKKSFNTAVLRAAQEVAPAGVSIEIAEIGDLPLYNEDLRHEGSFPAPVQRLRDQIAKADAVFSGLPDIWEKLAGGDGQNGKNGKKEASG